MASRTLVRVTGLPLSATRLIASSDHQRRVIGRDRVVGRLCLVFFGEGLDERRSCRILGQMTARHSWQYQPSTAGKPTPVKKLPPWMPSPPPLMHLGHDVIGLLGELDAGLRDAAIVERVGIEAFDLGQDGRVVGFLRVELVAAEDLDAVLPPPASGRHRRCPRRRRPESSRT